MIEVLENVFIDLENSLLHICHQAFVVNQLSVEYPETNFTEDLNPNTNIFIQVDEFKK